MLTTRNCVLLKDISKLSTAKRIKVARYIFFEDSNVINIWVRSFERWYRFKYVAYGTDKETDYDTKGLEAYLTFYDYAGADEIEKMKKKLPNIEQWESHEQLHYYNFEYSRQKIYDDIYVLDVNSSFTYGIMQLPEEFTKLKEYMQLLFEKKRTATSKAKRNKYKNLQNYLIGYFARIKDFISLRSEIIKYSNINVLNASTLIREKGGIVYLSNTDSIVTNKVGYEIMRPFIGDNLGEFKLEKKAKRLYYRSSNCYQIDDKVTFSGVKYFARNNIDFFKDRIAQQIGSLLESLDELEVHVDDRATMHVCRVRFGKIEVEIVNALGEVLEKKEYKIEEFEIDKIK